MAYTDVINPTILIIIRVEEKIIITPIKKNGNR